MIKKLIEWMIKKWLKDHHLSRNPAKGMKKNRERGISKDIKDKD